MNGQRHVIHECGRTVGRCAEHIVIKQSPLTSAPISSFHSDAPVSFIYASDSASVPNRVEVYQLNMCLATNIPYRVLRGEVVLLGEAVPWAALLDRPVEPVQRTREFSQLKARLTGA